MEFWTIINWSQRTYCLGLAGLRAWHELFPVRWVTLGHDQAGQSHTSKDFMIAEVCVAVVDLDLHLYENEI
jgi:hypothetical protein